jgi:hypothetical protein
MTGSCAAVVLRRRAASCKTPCGKRPGTGC